MNPQNAIEIRNLEKFFPKFKLGPLNVTVPQGAIYGFIGPNGAGKTTTIDLIFSMGEEDGGSITVLGVDHSRDEVAMKQQVAYVSPELNFRAWGRVGKALRFFKGFRPGWDDAYCEKLLNNFRLDRDDKIATLSFGSRIKLALIIALAWHPRLLILDEPTVGLDAVSKHQVFSELLAAVQHEERTVMISSHGLQDLERFADHIGMIKDGRMLLEGATDEVIECFRMVDFVTEQETAFANQPGLFIQQQEKNRWRVLLDIRTASLKWIESHGAKQVSAAPVTLEELFIALAKE